MSGALRCISYIAGGVVAGELMLKQWILLVIAFFALGWASANIINSLALDKKIETTNTEKTFPSIFTQGEKASPYDRIKEEQIHVYKDKVVIDVENAEWAAFTNTNSMDPVIDSEANAIEVVPKSEQDIHIGDIVSYDTEAGTVIHRVVQTGYDTNGWYAVMQGDNNPLADPEKVRFGQVRRVLVMVVY